jgi:hypothetical protein
MDETEPPPNPKPETNTERRLTTMLGMDDPRPGLPARKALPASADREPGVQSHYRFKHRGTDHISESGIFWCKVCVSGGTKR